jgi:hypothetical protein
MSISDFDSQYAGYGIPSIPAIDSGALATTTTPKTISLTVPALADGTQPTVIRGKVVISINTPGTAVLGQIDVSTSDGTHTVCAGSIVAAVAATGGRGGVFALDVFIDRVDTTTIQTIVVVIATSTSNVYTAEVRFLGEHD